MTRALYIVGAPGVGKTSLMRELKASYRAGDAKRVTPGSQLWVTPLYDDDALVAVELGRQRASFGGTDALGMAVMPHALHWIRNAPSLPPLILGEGARLGTAGFLTELAKRADLTVLHLVASADALAARRAARGSTQSRAWMLGAETRARNAVARLSGAVRVVTLDSTDLTPAELLHEEGS